MATQKPVAQNSRLPLPPQKDAGKREGQKSPPGKSRGCLAQLALLVALSGLLGGGAAAVGWYWLDATLPDVFSFEAYRQIAKESSRVYAAGGEVVARFGEEIRTVIPSERIPPAMRYAMVCAEDAAFFDHPGLDLAGIARALWVDVTKGRYAQGASTLTQQFAKTRFLGREKTFTRKFKELVLARKLESKLSKDEILTLYLNEVYFGHGRYGIEEAARYFCGRSTGELDVAQAALLAGIVNSPARFSPFRYPDRAKQRRAYVLGQMLRHGYISQADHDRADQQALPQKAQDKEGLDAAGEVGSWYVEAVRRLALDKVDREALYGGGLRIEVAMDVGLQRAAEEAVRRGLQKIDRLYRVDQPLKHYDDEASIQVGLQKLAAQQGEMPASGKVLLGVVVGEEPDGKAYRLSLGSVEGRLPKAALQRYEGARKLPDAKPTDAKAKKEELPVPQGPLVYRRGDLLRVSVRDHDEKGLLLSAEFGPQAALVALEPKTRLVRALVGGDDFDLHPYDRTRALRQPGSTFKTFAYGAAIEAGLVTADTELLDEKRTFNVAGRGWTPRNFSGTYDGRSYSLRDALAFSINSIAVEIGSRVGPEKIAELAGRVGIKSPLKAGLPLALGASSVTPIELTNAYATLAAGGRVAEPIIVTRIVDRSGKDLFLAPRGEGRSVLAEGVARQIVDMLGEVVRKGSGKEAQQAGRPVAGKTGTSNGGRDAWFVGFSADLAAGIWVGYDDRKEMPKGTGGALAVPIFTQFFKQGLAMVPVTPLPRLPHVLAGPVANLPAPLGDVEAGASDLEDKELAPDLPPNAPQEAPPPRAGKPRQEVEDEAVE